MFIFKHSVPGIDIDYVIPFFKIIKRRLLIPFVINAGNIAIPTKVQLKNGILGQKSL